MKKFLIKSLLIGLSIFGLNKSEAAMISNDVAYTTYTAVDTGGILMFSSAAIQLIAVNVSSPSNVGGFVTFYRSTSSVFTLEIGTQTTVNTWFGGPTYQMPVSIPMYNITNTSYTYMQKAGVGQVTIFFRCLGEYSRPGLCPGIKFSGQK